MTPTRRREQCIRFGAMGFATRGVVKAEGTGRAVRSAGGARNPQAAVPAFKPFP